MPWAQRYTQFCPSNHSLLFTIVNLSLCPSRTLSILLLWSVKQEKDQVEKKGWSSRQTAQKQGQQLLREKGRRVLRRLSALKTLSRKNCLASPVSWRYRHTNTGRTHLLERWLQLLPVMVLLHLLETQNLEGRQRPYLLHQHLPVTLFWGRKEVQKCTHILTLQTKRPSLHLCPVLPSQRMTTFWVTWAYHSVIQWWGERSFITPIEKVTKSCHVLPCKPGPSLSKMHYLFFHFCCLLS